MDVTRLPYDLNTEKYIKTLYTKNVINNYGFTFN